MNVSKTADSSLQNSVGLKNRDLNSGGTKAMILIPPILKTAPCPTDRPTFSGHSFPILPPIWEKLVFKPIVSTTLHRGILFDMKHIQPNFFILPESSIKKMVSELVKKLARKLPATKL
jgi:hypothetical protein